LHTVQLERGNPNTRERLPSTSINPLFRAAEKPELVQ
jgi:hypothetical protein